MCWRSGSLSPATEEKDPVVLPSLEDPAFAEAARETEPATDSEALTQTLGGLGDTLIQQKPSL